MIKNLERLNSGEVIPALYDPVFKALLTDGRCKDYLVDLINIVTKIPKKLIKDNLQYKNTEHIKNNIREKGKTSDLIVDVLNNRINLEMNMNYYEGVIQKNDAYQYKLAAEQYLVGESYIEEKRIIQINFDNYTKYDEREIIKFMILDVEKNIVGTENFVKYHVNLDLIHKKYYNKADLTKEQKELLLLTMKNKEEIEELVKGDDTMEKAKDKLVELSEDEELIGLYDKEEVERKIRNTIIQSAKMEAKMEAEREAEKRFEDGMEKGLEKGITQGIEQGENKKTKDIARNMLKENIDIDTISRITNLTIEEILKLK